MLFTYRPEGADERAWTYVPDKLMSSEAEAIEKVTGQDFTEFNTALLHGSVTARRALLWVLLKRTEPTLRHSQVDFPAGAVKLDFEAHELTEMREQINGSDRLSDGERAEALDGIALLLMDAGLDEDVEAPKAPGSSAASSD
jgi:hypothetical protein